MESHAYIVFVVILGILFLLENCFLVSWIAKRQLQNRDPKKTRQRATSAQNSGRARKTSVALASAGPASAAGNNGAHLGQSLRSLVHLGQDEVSPRSSNKRGERLGKGGAEEACKGQEVLNQSLLKVARPSAEHSSAATLRQSRKRDSDSGDCDADGTFGRELERRVRDVVVDVRDAFCRPVPKK
ncbi:unnamed protein product [Ixodes hexagonus]